MNEPIRAFFLRYNTGHYHSGLGLLTPGDVHYGRAARMVEDCKEVLAAAHKRRPERLRGRMPKPLPVLDTIWINRPVLKSDGKVY